MVTIVLGAIGLGSAQQGTASSSQLAILQPGAGLLDNPTATLHELRSLGVGVVRVTVSWASIAPQPSSPSPVAGFDAADRASYPTQNWAPFDRLVEAAQTLGITPDFTVTGAAPRWAEAADAPADALAIPGLAWRPSPAGYGLFVRALGTRYSGHYIPPGQSQPLPRVNFWALWNEPNFGKSLAPQASDGSTVATSVALYRDLLDPGWSALQATGHGRDTILIGSLDARGGSRPPGPGAPDGLPGNFNATKPLIFIRALYCVDGSLRQLRGAAATAIGCPATAAASQQFQAAHPGLFHATGVADHPYPVNLPPTEASAHDPDFTEFNELPRLERTLDRLQHIYGGHARFPIYVTEYGYVTNPPNHSGHFVGHSLEVWGCVRPAHFAPGRQRARIQFQRGSHGSWSTVRTVVITNQRGYFDLKAAFPASGSVRLDWRYPNGPSADSRIVKITVR